MGLKENGRLENSENYMYLPLLIHAYVRRPCGPKFLLLKYINYDNSNNSPTRTSKFRTTMT